MAELLVELFSEEIPARMQAQAARDLERMAKERLARAQLSYDSLRAFAGPRRLTLVVEGLPTAQADRTEARRGPKIDAPEAALEGFLRATGMERHQLRLTDGVYYADLVKPGRASALILGEMVEEILNDFPWPKSMRWGDSSFRWVRPLRRILCLFDGAVAPVAIGEIQSGRLTEGHRFMGTAKGPVSVGDFSDYRQILEDRFVVLEQEDRKRLILEGARSVCQARGVELVEDVGLLEEVSGLAEWPTPVLGEMAPEFLSLPPEVIRTSMRTHQKYFAARTPGRTGLAPYFVVVANIAAADGGAAVASGNAKVLSARLSDANFFWREDQKVPLMSRLEKLSGVTFHAKLGTMRQRVDRISAIAEALAPLVRAEAALAGVAARLCKADLATGMVGEFPELQGVMGGYYVRAEGERASGPASQGQWFSGLSPDRVDQVADAVRDHYKPIGPSDSVPTEPLTLAIALADKLDTLVSFFSIDEKPTGSRDPYGLRRAALGVIRLVLASKCELPMNQLLTLSAKSAASSDGHNPRLRVVSEVMSFLMERLKVLLREEGRRHDLVDAAFANGGDDIGKIVARVEALSHFLTDEDGVSLLAGYRRAVNILRAEAKKSDDPQLEPKDEGEEPPPKQEVELCAALRRVEAEVYEALAKENFVSAMTSLARLRGPVDAFFDKVLVNDKDPAVRLRRLRLLTQVRDVANRVADFSLISG